MAEHDLLKVEMLRSVIVRLYCYMTPPKSKEFHSHEYSHNAHCQNGTKCSRLQELLTITTMKCFFLTDKAALSRRYRAGIV